MSVRHGTEIHKLVCSKHTPSRGSGDHLLPAHLVGAAGALQHLGGSCLQVCRGHGVVVALPLWVEAIARGSQAVGGAGAGCGLSGEVVIAADAAKPIGTKGANRTGLNTQDAAGSILWAHRPVPWGCTVASCDRGGGHTSCCDPLRGAWGACPVPVDFSLEGALGAWEGLHGLHTSDGAAQAACAQRGCSGCFRSFPNRLCVCKHTLLARLCMCCLAHRQPRPAQTELRADLYDSLSSAHGCAHLEEVACWCHAGSDALLTCSDCGQHCWARDAWLLVVAGAEAADGADHPRRSSRVEHVAASRLGQASLCCLGQGGDSHHCKRARKAGQGRAGHAQDSKHHVSVLLSTPLKHDAASFETCLKQARIC